MLRLSPTKIIQDEADRLSEELRTAKRPVRVVSALHAGRSRVLRALGIRHPEAITIQLCESPDQIEHALLSCADKLGPRSVEAVDAALRASPDALEPALEALDSALGERLLFVDGADRLRRLGSDHQLSHAMSSQLDAFAGWLGDRRGVQTAATGRPEDRIRWKRPPVQLSNGRDYEADQLWRECDGEVDAFVLALEFAALEGDEDQLPSNPPSRQQVAELLPHGVFDLLSLLAAHDRPLAREIIANLGLTNAVDGGLRLGLWLDFDDSLVADGAWSRWALGDQREAARRHNHLRLARAFGRELSINDHSAARKAPDILEAFRHYIHAGEVTVARNYARHGAGLLIDHARGLSLRARYPDAAAVYETALDIADHDRLVLPKRMVAYARHYAHFNRARSKDASEAIETTIRGYRAALDDWPENALFWSRLVRANFFAEKPDAAFEAIGRAGDAVPQHPQRETILIARTVRGLLERERIFEAALVWDDYCPTNEFGLDVQHALQASLRAGWSTRNLRIPGCAQLFFNRSLRVRVEYLNQPKVWYAELLEVEASAQSTNPRKALAELSNQLRDETQRLLQSLTHRLDPEARLRKRVLLGAVDVVASRLTRWTPQHVWIFGELERGEDQRVRFCAHDDARFVIRSGVLPDEFALDEHPRFARLEADERGWPTGEVLELGEPFRRPADELWAEWQRRTAADDE